MRAWSRWRSTHVQGIHVFVVLALPVFGQSGEDRVLRHLTPKLLVQPVSEQVLGALQQHLLGKRAVQSLIDFVYYHGATTYYIISVNVSF